MKLDWSSKVDAADNVAEAENSDITVTVAPGVHVLKEPLHFDSRDSAPSGRRVVDTMEYIGPYHGLVDQYVLEIRCQLIDIQARRPESGTVGEG